jgi:hypothetical protein
MDNNNVGGAMQQQQLQLVARPIPSSQPEKTEQEAIPRSVWQPVVIYSMYNHLTYVSGPDAGELSILEDLL